MSRFTMLDAHQMGRRLLLRVNNRDGKGKHNDPRDIVAICDDGEGGTEAAIWNGGALASKSDLEAAEGIEILGDLDQGEQTPKERLRGVGKRLGGAAVSVVSGKI